MIHVWHKWYFDALRQVRLLAYTAVSCVTCGKVDTRPSRNSKEAHMNKFVPTLLALSLAMSSTAAFAGGPVVVEEEGQPEVMADSPRSGWIVPVIVGGIILCAIVCGNDDDTPVTTIPG
jgi:hypothetical protein